MHPLVNDLSNKSDNEIEEAIINLQRKYMIASNPHVQQQITLVIDSYKIELEERRIAAKKKEQENGNNDLDNLINIS